MLNKNLSYWLMLNHAPNIGPITINKLLSTFGSPKNIIKDNMGALKKLGLQKRTLYALQHPDWQTIEAECRWAEQSGQHIITLTDPEYPQLLKETASPPPLLYIKGQLAPLNARLIAIVGSRNPSLAGEETAQQFAYALSKAGFCITSGLALGIDVAGHRGALNAKGPTIAVLGSGVESIYPRRHHQLAKEITGLGCLISEFPLHMAPKAPHFPQRNRIISGLSLATLVIEAKYRSGSLITAAFANEQGRDVFAIPGSIRNPLARGCHQLIRDGAKLVETIDDILEELGISNTTSHPLPIRHSTTTYPEGLEKQHIKLLECVDFEVTSIDQMIIRSRLSASTVTTILLILELHGYISSVPGGYRRVR